MRPANPAGGAELLILVKSAKSVESPKSAQALDAAGKASAPAHAPHLPPVGEASAHAHAVMLRSVQAPVISELLNFRREIAGNLAML